MPKGPYQKIPGHYCLEVDSFNQKAIIEGEFLELTILGWERNKDFKCTCSEAREGILCYFKTDTDLQHISSKISPTKITSSILKVKVKNMSSQLLNVDFADEHSRIIDTRGYVRKLFVPPCEIHTLKRGWQDPAWCDLYEDTQAKFRLWWPELEDGIDIQKFIYEQNIFDPGQTAGWVQEREVYEFKLIEAYDIDSGDVDRTDNLP